MLGSGSGAVGLCAETARTGAECGWCGSVRGIRRVGPGRMQGERVMRSPAAGGLSRSAGEAAWGSVVPPVE